MAKLAAHQSAVTTKMLFIGDSGAGKTGALASLAGAGSGARGRRGSGKSWLSYSVRMPL